MASPTSTVSLNILDDARAAYENISRQLRQLMSEKDAHVLEYTSLLQSRADEEQRQDLQEVIASMHAATSSTTYSAHCQPYQSSSQNTNAARNNSS
ncbi:hypothetical protein K7432_018061 [Basidiobolus ranarum]|uniref:Uncharacterized protein n=1 Tax=Basidiobolus ranarum TaxID=34480 RepID=A0ABR2VJM9_9FUNG